MTVLNRTPRSSEAKHIVYKHNSSDLRLTIKAFHEYNEEGDGLLSYRTHSTREPNLGKLGTYVMLKV